MSGDGNDELFLEGDSGIEQAPSRILSRDEILQASDIQREVVNVPEWGGSVIVQGLSGAARDDFEEASMKGKGRNRELNVSNLRARLVVRSVVDESGVRLFQDNDAHTLGRKSAAALQRVYNVASRLSGISAEDEEELTKNYEPVLNGASTSGSH